VVRRKLTGFFLLVTSLSGPGACRQRPAPRAGADAAGTCPAAQPTAATAGVPWCRLTDEELRRAIERAGGRVGIGFKEARAPRLIGPRGPDAVSPEVVRRMKAYLRSRGVRITREDQLIPAVVATMPARLQLVRELRWHPNVDYLEPVVMGTRG
jgi:hypothetical protein